MQKITNKIKEELVLKLDFVNNQFEIGWIWVILQIPSAYLIIKDLFICLLKN